MEYTNTEYFLQDIPQPEGRNSGRGFLKWGKDDELKFLHINLSLSRVYFNVRMLK